MDQLEPNQVNKRSSGVGFAKMPPGPFLAKVVNHLDPKRQGSLRVQLLTNTVSVGDNLEEGQLFTANYCSPFYGVTDVKSNGKNNDYYNTQQSYGFWAVPPDPGTKVLVIFAEGSPNQCYWIGCVQDEYMNNMVPGGYPADKVTNIVQDGIASNLKGKSLPVGEFNKSVSGNGSGPLDRRVGNDPDKFPRPINPMMSNILAKQGLEEDVVRGTTTTSSRRDIPNTVYGWNTPGPLDKRDGRPKGNYGDINAKARLFRSRLGGSAFTMDDGDPSILRMGIAKENPATYYDIENTPENTSKGDATLPFNEHIRLRSRTGHQILLHNTEDLIYIGNANGTAWIELTSNGKIDVYAQDSINLRTETDLNIKADRDINIESGKDINFTAGRNYKLMVNNDRDVKTNKNETTFVGKDKNEWTGDNHTVAVGSDQDIQIKGSHRTTISTNYSLQVAGDGKIAINGEYGSKVAGNYRQVVVGAYNLSTTGDNKFTSGANTQIKSTGTHKETAAQIHMNSPSQEALGADNISDTFTAPVTSDTEDKTLSSTGVDLTVSVSSDALRASVAATATRPRRIPKHEPWDAHENINPQGHTPSATASILAPSPEVRSQSPQIDKDSDIPDYSTTSGIYNAQEAFIRDPVTGERVKETFDADKIPTKNTDNLAGKQPADPVPVDDMQRFFLSELIKGLGLDPITWKSNAHALAMACAQIQKECNFEPRSENMNYRVSTLQRVWPNRFGGDAGKRKAETLVAGGPPAIANSVYGNRMGNGSAESGDGFRYRGRGLIQITGTDNYRTYGGKAGVDIYNNADMANDPTVATKIAVAYLKSKSVTWTSTDFNALGTEFKKAVGYADAGGSNTASRIGLGKGFYQKIINNELTPLASLTTTTPIDTGAGKSQVQ
jgi:predicted chitinase|tara:strand:+ start:139 stop:2820 length:2682 start_codon:yes stop_codon:yes gene_type:complete